VEAGGPHLPKRLHDAAESYKRRRVVVVTAGLGGSFTLEKRKGRTSAYLVEEKS